jgi:hypothetical protein
MLFLEMGSCGRFALPEAYLCLDEPTSAGLPIHGLHAAATPGSQPDNSTSAHLAMVQTFGAAK